MKRLLLSCCLGCMLAGSHSVAQQTNLPPTQEERYLFVVDTASSMKRLSRACRQALFDLVHWGVGGHMQWGDTYGLWTFDADAYPGRFPLQVWDQAKQVELASKASLFLKEQHYRNKADMAPVIQKILAVVRAVQDVNVFIITDAASPIRGLPFDSEINGACEQRREEMRQAKQPFIIAVVARDGEVVQASINLAGEPIILPPRRPLPQPAALAQPTAPKPTPKSPLAKARSLAEKNTSPQKSEPAPASTVNLPESNSPKQKPLGQVLSLRAFTSSTPIPPPSTSEQSQHHVLPQEAAIVQQEPANLLPPNIDPAPTVVEQAPSRIEPEPPSASPVHPIPAEPDHSPAPAPSLPTPPADASAPTVVGSPPVPVAAREPGSPRSSTREMPVTPVPSRGPSPVSSRELYAAGALLLLIAIGFVFFSIRRSLPTARASLITRSIQDRSNPPRP